MKFWGFTNFTCEINLFSAHCRILILQPSFSTHRNFISTYLHFYQHVLTGKLNQIMPNFYQLKLFQHIFISLIQCTIETRTYGMNLNCTMIKSFCACAQAQLQGERRFMITVLPSLTAYVFHFYVYKIGFCFSQD